MISFKPIDLEDQSVIRNYYPLWGTGDCNLSFESLFSRQKQKNSFYAILNTNLVIQWDTFEGETVYTLPVGEVDVRESISLLYKEAKQKNQPLCIYGVFPFLKNLFDKLYPNAYSTYLSVDWMDYIYSRDSLATLRGTKFQQKRNHVNQFKKRYNYHYQPLTKELINCCLDFLDKWYLKHSFSDDINLKYEREAVLSAFDNFDSLDLLGMVLFVDKQIIGFTYGSPVKSDMFATHIEKVDRNFVGAYAFINQEFAKSLPSEYKYINREEDLGILELRKSKQSYRPAYLLEKGFIKMY